jgi:hypothetical protein
MLSRRIPLTDQKEREHLVIELKRPKRKIDLEVQSQIVSYAEAVTRVEWPFGVSPSSKVTKVLVTSDSYLSQENRGLTRF